jgi:translation initiation factor IF-2
VYALGIMVTMNQRLDAETLTIVADEFGYEVEFITVDIEDLPLLRTGRRFSV